jgi:chromosome segregation ATPase
MKDIKRGISNSFKELQENTSKKVEALKKETHKFLKERQESAIKQIKKLNKTIQDLKIEIESLKKIQRETALKMENLGKRTGVTDANITNRIQEIEERISVAENTIEDIDTTVKENTKSKKLLS